MDATAAPVASMTGRNYGIDLLRMGSMLLVTLLHILGNDGVLAAAAEGSAGYWCAWFLECAAFCAVDCYALISGYVGWRSEFRLGRLLSLWLQVFFWSVVSAGVMFLTHPETFSLLGVMQALFPVLSERYWYFTAYFVMCFFTPLLNLAIRSLPREKLWSSALGITALLSLVSTVTPWKDTLVLNGGYHFIWLGVLYLLGGCLSRYPVTLFRRNGARLAAYLLCTAVLLLSKPLLRAATTLAYGQGLHDGALISYLSPLVIAQAVLLLSFFTRLRVRPLTPLVGRLCAASFGVYLIHTGSYFWSYLLRGAFAPLTAHSAPLLVGEVLLSALGIYAACALPEICREKLFALARLPRAADAVGDRITRLWSKLLAKADKNRE